MLTPEGPWRLEVGKDSFRNQVLSRRRLFGAPKTSIGMMSLSKSSTRREAREAACASLRPGGESVQTLGRGSKRERNMKESKES